LRGQSVEKKDKENAGPPGIDSSARVNAGGPAFCAFLTILVGNGGKEGFTQRRKEKPQRAQRGTRTLCVSIAILAVQLFSLRFCVNPLFPWLPFFPYRKAYEQTFTLFYSLLFFGCCFTLDAQSLTQTVRGRIVDRETQTPLPGATVQLLGDSAGTTGTATDADGYYRLDKVNVGRRTLRFGYIGYQHADVANVVVTSGKEVILNVQLEASAQMMDEVVVSATNKAEASNEMATVSARTFSVDETKRYPGSRDDPARMASNFAGVQGSNDSRNDIVIRATRRPACSTASKA
jgi:hypothetical protein